MALWTQAEQPRNGSESAESSIRFSRSLADPSLNAKASENTAANPLHATSNTPRAGMPPPQLGARGDETMRQTISRGNNLQRLNTVAMGSSAWSESRCSSMLLDLLREKSWRKRREEPGATVDRDVG